MQQLHKPYLLKLKVAFISQFLFVRNKAIWIEKFFKKYAMFLIIFPV